MTDITDHAEITQPSDPHSVKRLVAAARSHLAFKRAAACVLPVPETHPPLFVAVGPAPAIAKLLQAEVDLDVAIDAGDIAGHARALRRKRLAQLEASRAEDEVARQRKHAALQELADIAQENDMGYDLPKKAALDVEFDESEGGHHD